MELYIGLGIHKIVLPRFFKLRGYEYDHYDYDYNDYTVPITDILVIFISFCNRCSPNGAQFMGSTRSRNACEYNGHEPYEENIANF